MVLLMIFAFVAGAATALSPCALPVLPVVFSAGVTGGRRRPLGIATGLAVSFTFAVVVLVYLLAALGLSGNLLRTLAIAVLLVFGLSLIMPRVAEQIEAAISHLTSRSAGRVAGATQSRTEGEDGFWSGVLVGGGLGFVYAPCAGPILAGVITATASQTFTAGRLAVALAYGVGSAVTFFALMVGGRRLIAPLVQRSQKLQIAMGVSMVLVAVAMFANLDTRFQTAIANDLPAVLVNPTEKLEKSSALQDDLAPARGKESSKFEQSDSGAAGPRSSLPDLGPVPDFVGGQRWFNTPGGKPLTRAELRGKVVLVDFWTYTCINCIRTLPYLKSWYDKYADKGFVIVGVHTPEFPFEKKASNVESAIRQSNLQYPIVQDNDYNIWDSFENQYWPAHYLVDANGRVRDTHFGEGKYDETEAAIRSLLAERGSDHLGADAKSPDAESPPEQQITPETYLGAQRSNGYFNGTIHTGRQNYGAPPRKLHDSEFAYAGHWDVSDESATATGADSRLVAEFTAQRVFLVLGSPAGRRRLIGVELDGHPISPADAGADVKRGKLAVTSQRLYRLVDLDSVQRHRLTLHFAPGISGYAFTFG